MTAWTSSVLSRKWRWSSLGSVPKARATSPIDVAAMPWWHIIEAAVLTIAARACR